MASNATFPKGFTPIGKGPLGHFNVRKFAVKANDSSNVMCVGTPYLASAGTAQVAAADDASSSVSGVIVAIYDANGLAVAAAPVSCGSGYTCVGTVDENQTFTCLAEGTVTVGSSYTTSAANGDAATQKRSAKTLTTTTSGGCFTVLAKTGRQPNATGANMEVEVMILPAAFVQA